MSGEEDAEAVGPPPDHFDFIACRRCGDLHPSVRCHHAACRNMVEEDDLRYGRFTGDPGLPSESGKWHVGARSFCWVARVGVPLEGAPDAPGWDPDTLLCCSQECVRGYVQSHAQARQGQALAAAKAAESKRAAYARKRKKDSARPDIDLTSKFACFFPGCKHSQGAGLSYSDLRDHYRQQFTKSNNFNHSFAGIHPMFKTPTRCPACQHLAPDGQGFLAHVFHPMPMQGRDTVGAKQQKAHHSLASHVVDALSIEPAADVARGMPPDEAMAGAVMNVLGLMYGPEGERGMLGESSEEEEGGPAGTGPSLDNMEDMEALLAMLQGQATPEELQAQLEALDAKLSREQKRVNPATKASTGTAAGSSPDAPAPPAGSSSNGGGGGGLKCAACGSSHAKSEYSKGQLKKKGKRKCKTCCSKLA